MSNPENFGGIVLRCSQDLVVVEVLYSELIFQPEQVLHRPFAALAQQKKEDPVLHFVEALRQFGSAEGWHLPLLLGNTPLLMTFSGMRMYQQYILAGHLYVQPQPEREIADNGGTSQLGLGNPIDQEDKRAFTVELDDHELLDELSRLNNELINNKRELVRQQVKQERKKKE